MLFSILNINHKLSVELINSNFIAAIYFFVGQNLITALLPIIFAIGYAFISFSILKNDSRQQIIMVMNAIILIILSLIIGTVFYYHTAWLNFQIMTTFTKAMAIIGLLNIMLSFVPSVVKDK
jgi:Na+-translocating ferredoxin:NAD+ oxidoreductase RnfD subunit